jgi:hypothetical protein
MINQSMECDFKLRTPPQDDFRFNFNNASEKAKASSSGSKISARPSSSSDYLIDFNCKNFNTAASPSNSVMVTTTHTCKDCLRSFKDVNNYKEHRFQEHQITDYPNIRKCSMCSYATLLKSKYDCHMR